MISSSFSATSVWVARTKPSAIATASCCKNIHFVEGNHDRAARKSAAAFCSLEPVGRDPGRQARNRALSLRHADLASFLARCWHLYGHSHGNLRDDPASLSIDIGVDVHDFQPRHFDEISAVMEAKRRIAAELCDDGKESTHEKL